MAAPGSQGAASSVPPSSGGPSGEHSSIPPNFLHGQPVALGPRGQLSSAAAPTAPSHERVPLHHPSWESDGSILKDAGFLAAPPMQASGFAERGSQVDVTVMAYAQWLSEMKQQSTNARYQQQADLDLMRDAINANNGELVDFKRHSSQVVQQLQGQVTEIRAKLSDAFAEMAQQSRQRQEAEQRTGNAINGLQQSLSSRTQTQDSSNSKWKEQLDRVDARTKNLDSEMASMKRSLGSSQEQTIMKFGELDRAMSILQGNVNTSRQELTDTREDWKKSQDLLGQAISTLSQDLADFQKHASTVMNKLQSDAYHFEELGRDNKERCNRVEAQLAGIQQSVYNTSNDLILLKEEKGVPMARTPPNNRMVRSDSNGTILDAYGAPYGAAPLPGGQQVIPGSILRPQPSMAAAADSGVAKMRPGSLGLPQSVASRLPGPPASAPRLPTPPLVGRQPQ